MGLRQMTGPMSSKKRSTSQPAAYDCETAALLRAVMLPLFHGAKTWAELIEVMRKRGYGLAFRDGAFCVTERGSGKRLCGLNFLGLSMEDLVNRLGRPCVLAHHGDWADGDLLSHPPTRSPLH
ncbi:hypothetical protein MB818_13280 [Ruegeria sp. 1NDH52C]|uniref:Uncharacterized protein n=1 Tax=Ruegeria alba TaxID=2916756 RepID=A0ABS9P067_9RHOB|nr:hypothetical protein [Ruegeria alba]MCG6559180.1 hypothetical protein [Ruegeria alba]